MVLKIMLTSLFCLSEYPIEPFLLDAQSFISFKNWDNMIDTMAVELQTVTGFTKHVLIVQSTPVSSQSSAYLGRCGT